MMLVSHLYENGGRNVSKSYSLTRADLLTLIENIRTRHGDKFKMMLVKLEQGNGYDMSTSQLTVDATYALLRRIPRNYDNPDGIQRALKDAKVNNIEKIARDDEERFSSPNAVVLNLVSGHEYVSIVMDQENGRIRHFVIDLEAYEKVVAGAQVDLEGYLLDERIFPGIMLDGHHRTAGLYQATKLGIDLPVTAYIDLPPKDMAKVFADINVYQEKPSTVHSLAMKALSGTLSSREEGAHSIVTLLNERDWSVLYQRVKDIDGPRPKDLPKSYVTNSTLVKLIEGYVLDTMPTKISTSRKAQILNDYFKAWSEVYPTAWNDEKSHVLVKSMGFQIMLRVFDKIYTMLGSDGIPSKQSFKTFLENYMDTAEKLNVYEKELTLDWNSRDYGGYSSGKGINDIVAAVQKHITDKHYSTLEQVSS